MQSKGEEKSNKIGSESQNVLIDKISSNRNLQSKSIDGIALSKKNLKQSMDQECYGNYEEEKVQNNQNSAIKSSNQNSEEKYHKIQEKFTNLKSNQIDSFKEIQKFADNEVELDLDYQVTINADQNYQTRHSENKNGLNDTQFLLNYALKSSTKHDENDGLSRPEYEDQLKLTNQASLQDSPYADKTAIHQPNSTKNKQNIKFQPSVPFNPQQTQPQFNQIVAAPPKSKTKQQTQQQVPPKKQRVDNIWCQAISVEPYLKRNMQKLGWIDLTTTTANFHIRFDITDNQGNQNKLKNSQWYNHFPNNRELTTKAGLCKNLWQQCPYDYELQIEKFFPRCYDLSDSKSIDLFINDFQQTAVLSIVKMHAQHFQRNTKNIQTYLNQFKKRKEYNVPKVFKQKFKFRCSQIDQMLSGAGSMLGNDILRLAMQYAKQQVIKKRKINTNSKSLRKFNEEEINLMCDYSYALANGEEAIKQKFPLYDQIKTIIIHEKLEKYLYQYRTIDGLNNVWVVKPSYNARGLGVYCANKLKDIIQQGKKTQPKIVQKYIENPILINNKKFDIRQWALITSWEPLDVYIFQSAYLKICGSEFTLSNLSDNFRHLSNFTIQKNNKQAGSMDEFVMSHEQFENYLRSIDPKYENFTWEKNLYPMIQDVIYKTFKGVQDSMEQRNNTFEIYGFDIILDDQLQPWVIEVNLSPACNERTEFLTQMLDDMSLDLLQYLENRIIMQNNVDTEWQANFKERKEQLLKKQTQSNQSLSLNDEQFYTDQQLKHRWIRVSDCILEFKNYQLMNNNIQNKGMLELLGQKADIKLEKRIDKNNQKYQSTFLIQRLYRGYKGRQIYKRLLQNKSSIIIQQYLRRRLAKSKVKSIIQNNASILIQRYLRTQLSIYKVDRMKNERLQKATLYIALQLQSHYRRRKALSHFIQMMKNAKSIVIQKHIRRKLAVQKVRQMMNYKCKIVRIQRFYKKRFNLRKKASIKVQKYMKAMMARHKVQKFIMIQRGSQKLKMIVEKKLKQKAMKQLQINKSAIIIQSILKRYLTWMKYQKILKDKAKLKIQHIFKKYLFKRLNLFAAQYKNQKSQKCILLQKHLRSFLSHKKINFLKLMKYKNQKATIIKKNMKMYLAKTLVQFKKRQLWAIIKIQSIARVLIAKNIAKKIKILRAKKENKKKKEIDKKFDKAKKVEKDIENYIESLFHREIQQQRQMKQILTQTPISQRRLKDQQAANLQKESQFIRQSFTSQTNLGMLRNQEKVGSEQKYVAEISTKPNTNATQFQRIGAFYDNSKKKQSGNKYQQQNEEFDIESIENGEYNDNEILATSGIMQDGQNQGDPYHWNTIDRQQKALRIRKKKNGGTLGKGKGGRGAYLQQLESIPQKQKQYSNGENIAASNQSSQRQAQSVMPQIKRGVQNIPKPKTFAENLMNMLAKQNIGQAFSENPVEALGILKEDPSKNSSMKAQRRNSNVSRVGNDSNQSFLLKNNQNQYGHDSHSAAQTIEPQTKVISFPKLNEFKSATNNIYLSTRPILDPRSESEFQQQLLETKAKHTKGLESLNKSNNNIQSKGELQPLIEGRRSTESLARQNTVLPSFTQTNNNLVIASDYLKNDNLLLQPRPNKDNNTSHLMVVQAYKKQQHPSHQDHFRKKKKRGESIVEGGQNIKQDSVQNTNEKGRNKKQSKDTGNGFIPPILENSNKIIII